MSENTSKLSSNKMILRNTSIVKIEFPINPMAMPITNFVNKSFHCLKMGKIDFYAFSWWKMNVYVKERKMENQKV